MIIETNTTTTTELVRATCGAVTIRTTVVKTATHTVTPRQWQALDRLIRTGGVEGWTRDGKLFRILVSIGLAKFTESGNGYRATEAGRLAHANVENRRRALPRK